MPCGGLRREADAVGAAGDQLRLVHGDGAGRAGERDRRGGEGVQVDGSLKVTVTWETLVPTVPVGLIDVTWGPTVSMV